MDYKYMYTLHTKRQGEGNANFIQYEGGNCPVEAIDNCLKLAKRNNFQIVEIKIVGQEDYQSTQRMLLEYE